MNNTGTPATVRQAIVNRQVQAAKTPVYTTITMVPSKGHRKVVEMEHEHGGRTWSAAMDESSVQDYIDSFPEWYSLSDIDCSAKCWCVTQK